MANYNTLNWQNENELSSYPLSEDIEPNSLIVDARFVQFDNFIPILNSITIQSDSITLEILFDHGTNTSGVFYKASYTAGEAYRQLRIYTPDKSRYLGVITFGQGAETLWSSYVGRKLQPVTQFLPSTVYSIPSQDAVYTFDGNYGDVQLSRTPQDSAIFYNTSLGLNSIVLNAVGGHAVPEGQLPVGLKQINYVKPLNNNITLASNEILKINSFNTATLTIDLVSGKPSSSFTLPTLTV